MVAILVLLPVCKSLHEKSRKTALILHIQLPPSIPAVDFLTAQKAQSENLKIKSTCTCTCVVLSNSTSLAHQPIDTIADLVHGNLVMKA